MGLDMWFREDCQRILASVLETQRNAARALPALDAEAAIAYHRGFVDALKAVAVGFGIAPPTTNKPMRQVASPGCDNELGRR